nr:hypothetical protein [Tanacetum cinerariifolium]
MGLWLCGVCFKTHTLRSKCRHGKDLVPPLDGGDGVVMFVLYDLIKPQVSCPKQFDHVKDLEESIFNVVRSWRETLAEPSPSWSNIDEENLDLGERNVNQCKRKTCDGHYTVAVRVFSSSSVALYNEATLDYLKTKHPFKPAPSLPHTPIDHHQLIASPAVVLDMIKSFLRCTSCGRDGLCAQHLMAISDELISSITHVVNLFIDGKCPKMLGEYIASASLTPLVKPRGVRCWGSRGGEAILHAINQLIGDRGDDVGLSMLLVDFKNAFNLVDREACYLDDDTIIRDTLIVGEVLKVIMEDGPCEGLHLNVDETERLSTLPFAFGGLGVYSAGDVLNYAFLASRLQSAVHSLLINPHSSASLFGNHSLNGSTPPSEFHYGYTIPDDHDSVARVASRVQPVKRCFGPTTDTYA